MLKNERLEQKLDELSRKVEAISIQMADIEETNKIKRILKDQEKGLIKYFLEMLRIIAAIVFIAAAGNKALDSGWVDSIVKTNK